MSYYREQLENWLKNIEVDANHVIDIGGASNPIKSRVKSFNAENYTILDNGIEAGSFDIAVDINKPLNSQIQEDELSAPANVIFCLEVFEYVYDPIIALKNIRYLLAEGGVAYISFPFVYPQHNPVSNDYLRYTPTGVAKLLFETGFSNVEFTNRGDRSGLLKQFYQADGMHPAKELDHSVYGVMVKATK